MLFPLLAPALALATPAVASVAVPTAVGSPDAPVYGDEARDRRSILAMAGAYDVTFDLRETVALVPGYTLLPSTPVHAQEVVRVAEDTSRQIVLQHLLVLGERAGPTRVIKHWRQDWRYQPATVLRNVGPGRWAVCALAAEARRGAWSQTVWQVDDSPRYGGVGRWRYDGGAARWTSDETRRPLARRDAERDPPYDHYVGVNRHLLTPTGWVQEQDNAKLATHDGTPVAIAHEVGVNAYARSGSIPVAPADDYWAKTARFWAGVRAAWAAAIEAAGGLTLDAAPIPQVSGAKGLTELADEVARGERSPDQALASARAVIARRAAH